MGRTLSFTIPAQWEGGKIYDYLRKEQKLSYRLITSLKHIPEGITQNGVHARTIDRLRKGDILSVNLPEEGQEMEISTLEVPVIYEDEDLLVYDKPAGMNCHQSRRVQNDTLANVFAGYCQSHGVPPQTFRCLNRLDKDTSGLVLLGKNQHAAALVKHTVEKEYWALVCGRVEQDSGTVDAPISRINEIYTKRQVDPEGQPSVTHYRVEARGEGYTLLSFRLETGRTHQIRVHMAHLGHPLAGDDMYGGDTTLLSRQALHCRRMRFVSPLNGKQVEISAPMPQDIQKAMENVRISVKNE